MRIALLIGHLMVIAIGTGMSFANYINLRRAQRESGERAAALAGLRRTIARIADVVIVLIWATGLALLWAWMGLVGGTLSGWFYAKLGFVVVLTVCHGLARHTAARMARTQDASLLASIEFYVAGVWLSALASIVLAVVAFRL